MHTQWTQYSKYLLRTYIILCVPSPVLKCVRKCFKYRILVERTYEFLDGLVLKLWPSLFARNPFQLRSQLLLWCVYCVFSFQFVCNHSPGTWKIFCVSWTQMVPSKYESCLFLEIQCLDFRKLIATPLTTTTDVYWALVLWWAPLRTFVGSILTLRNPLRKVYGENKPILQLRKLRLRGAMFAESE